MIIKGVPLMNRLLGTKKQFWKYVISMRQDSTGIPTLFSDGKEFNTAREKASVLNNLFLRRKIFLIFQVITAMFPVCHQ